MEIPSHPAYALIFSVIHRCVPLYRQVSLSLECDPVPRSKAVSAFFRLTLFHFCSGSSEPPMRASDGGQAPMPSGAKVTKVGVDPWRWPVTSGRRKLSCSCCLAPQSIHLLFIVKHRTDPGLPGPILRCSNSNGPGNSRTRQEDRCGKSQEDEVIICRRNRRQLQPSKNWIGIHPRWDRC